jgi:hypothetical protein
MLRHKIQKKKVYQVSQLCRFDFRGPSQSAIVGRGLEISFYGRHYVTGPQVTDLLTVQVCTMMLNADGRLSLHL